MRIEDYNNLVITIGRLKEQLDDLEYQRQIALTEFVGLAPEFDSEGLLTKVTRGGVNSPKGTCKTCAFCTRYYGSEEHFCEMTGDCVSTHKTACSEYKEDNDAL